MVTVHYKHIVVVHGIGNHAPNETALGFMNELIRNLPRSGRYKLSPRNLIATVDLAPNGTPRAFRPSYMVFTDGGTHHVISFSEVLWRPITDAFRKTNNGPPIPIPTWARSIGTRLLGPGYDQRLWREAVANLETMLGLLEKAALLHKKSAQLRAVLDSFLGDVQCYAESDDLSEQIQKKFLGVMDQVGRFSDEAMEEYCKEFKDPVCQPAARKIYVVAHSEGTMVAFNSVILAARRRHDAEVLTLDDPYPWLDEVDGFVTLGSPIDKHFTIWDTRFKTNSLAGMVKIDKRIPWYNIWDQSDPVGYGVGSVWDGSQADAWKLFDLKYDDGYSRSLVPGKAHVDYWTDRSVHQKIIREVMGLTPDKPRVHIISKWSRILPWVDYILYIAVRVATLAVIYAAMNLLLGAKPIWNAYQPQLPGFMSSSGRWLPNGWLIPSWWLLAKGLAAAALVELADWIAKPYLQHFRSDAGRRILAVWPEAVSIARNSIVVLGYFAALVGIRAKLGAPGADVMFWLLLPVIAGKSIGEIMLLARWGRLAKVFRAAMALVWIWFAADISMRFHLAEKPYKTITDGAGYLCILIGAALVWSLHTTIHRGLVQMWRYSMDDDASALARDWGLQAKVKGTVTRIRALSSRVGKSDPQ